MEWLPLEYICFHLRAIDWQEIHGNLPSGNPLYLASMLMQAVARQGVGWVAFLGARPAAWLAVFEQWPGNWQVSLAGTDAFPGAILALRACWPKAVRYAVRHGCHRIEARSHDLHHEGRRLAKSFGAAHEGVLRAYGRDGHDYHQLAWTGAALREAARSDLEEGLDGSPSVSTGDSNVPWWQ
jgi:hypothetical protein